MFPLLTRGATVRPCVAPRVSKGTEPEFAPSGSQALRRVRLPAVPMLISMMFGRLVMVLRGLVNRLSQIHERKVTTPTRWAWYDTSFLNNRFLNNHGQ